MTLRIRLIVSISLTAIMVFIMTAAGCRSVSVESSIFDSSRLSVQENTGSKKPVVEDKQEAEKIATVPYVSKNDEGTVSGTISFEGPLPQALPFDPSGDMVCYAVMEEKVFNYYKIEDGKLADALVYVTGNGIEGYSFPVLDSPVVLERRECQFVPRVVGLMVEQTLLIRNSDPTSHNTHPRPKINWGWNMSQPAASADIKRTFEKPEELIPVKCDLHPWETAFISVFNHPFFAVSGGDGTYSIKGLPPGDYMLVFQHEKLGKQEMPVTVSANSTVVKDIAFRQSSTG